MKEKKLLPDRLAVYGGLALLLALGLAALLFRQDFSAWERRQLSQLPANISLTDWTFHDDLEDELSDQIPCRRLLVNLYAQAQVLTGRAVQLDAWPVGDAIVEKPVSADPAVLTRRVEQLTALCGEIPCLFLTPPTHGMLRMDQMSAPRRAVYVQELSLYHDLMALPGQISLEDAFRAHTEQLYYRTDHHWTLDGARLAYHRFCEAAGLTPKELDAFTLTEYPGFLGTTYSRSGLPFAQADILRCAEPAAPVSVLFSEEDETYAHLIFPEQAQTYDGYAVYLKGNHGLVTITSPQAEADRTLLVFRDSFANSFLPFLTPHYSRIIAADARYMDGSFREVLAGAGPVDQVLFLYSLDSLANDTSIPRKLR